MIAKLTEWWRGTSRWERVVWCLVALCLLGAVAVKPLVRWASPQLAVDALLGQTNKFYYRSQTRGRFAGQILDPWGNPWALRIVGQGSRIEGLLNYSTGPNGIDDVGQGDDLSVDLARWRSASWLAAWSRELFLALALWIPWVSWGFPRQFRAPRSRRVRGEFAQAAFATSVPALCVSVACFWFLGLPGAGQFSSKLSGPLLVQPWVAVSGTATLLCFLLALWWRLTRPQEG